MLSPQDKGVIERSLEGVTNENRDTIIQIHKEGVARLEKREAELTLELQSVERAKAMRLLALALLDK